MLYETPVLETERLILKRGTLDDFQHVYEYDFTKLRNINGEFEFVKVSPEVIAKYGFEIPVPETYDWIMYLKESGEAIGNVVADRENKDINSIELAFNTHPNYWKKGYTYEALIEIMRFLFSTGYDNILCGYDEGNIKSKSIGEKLGFEPYKTIPNAWKKNGKQITTYVTILSKEKFYEVYDEKNS